MQTTTLIANPFAMMLDPERIAREVEHSERLNRLQRRICRPLDKPLIPKGVAELDAYDRMIEDTVVEPEELADEELAASPATFDC
ncbi:hypothetical protein RQP53_00240 [Paucibacter sp. APW11]|uniref:Uncharacterized protein n=1 Tax=Roseateles aquae TaxID=3077235 RepID=A0ABU3P546_9BURK|nr:hypothetical protein [Paucibacter sp. APW11]MDT8997696.1 hypothetical protein [Paucibacter sp. APW11]